MEVSLFTRLKTIYQKIRIFKQIEINNMLNDSKPNNNSAITEVNGVKYFKLQSQYPGD